MKRFGGVCPSVEQAHTKQVLTCCFVLDARMGLALVEGPGKTVDEEFCCDRRGGQARCGKRIASRARGPSVYCMWLLEARDAVLHAMDLGLWESVETDQ